MDENTSDAFVNRDEPIPVIVPEAMSGSEAQSSDSKGKRERVKNSMSSTSSKLKDKYQEHSASNKEPGSSLQDRLFTK